MFFGGPASERRRFFAPRRPRHLLGGRGRRRWIRSAHAPCGSGKSAPKIVDWPRPQKVGRNGFRWVEDPIFWKLKLKDNLLDPSFSMLVYIYQPPANPAGLSWAWDCQQHGEKHHQKQQQQQQQPTAAVTATTNSNSRKPTANSSLLTANKNSSTGEGPGDMSWFWWSWCLCLC